VHFWLPRIFATAGAALPPALMAFMLGAGLLGGLRLLPLGEIDAWVAGEVLRWWAWLTLAYAGFVGLLQTHPRSILAYAAIALGGLWLGVLSACLQQPQLWQAAADTLAIVLIQSEFALAAMLLIDKANESEQSLSHGYLISGLNWLAALLLATAPLGMAEVMADRVAEMPIHWAIPVIAFLAANSLLRRDKGAVAMPEGKNSLSGTGQTWRLNMHGSIQVMMSASLTTLSAFAFVFKLVEASFGEIALAALILLASLLVAVLSTKFIATRLPALPPGDVLVSISHGLVLARNHAHRLIGTSALRWPDLGQALVRRLWSRMARKNVTEQWGTALDRWPTALVLMLLVGLLVAWMAGQG